MRRLHPLAAITCTAVMCSAAYAHQPGQESGLTASHNQEPTETHADAKAATTEAMQADLLKGSSPVKKSGNARIGSKNAVKGWPRLGSGPEAASPRQRPRNALASESFSGAAAMTSGAGMHSPPAVPAKSQTGFPGRVKARSSLQEAQHISVLTGLQFRNSRDPGARMAVSGGPANSMRGTAAINGSDIKRKP